MQVFSGGICACWINFVKFSSLIPFLDWMYRRMILNSVSFSCFLILIFSFSSTGYRAGWCRARLSFPQGNHTRLFSYFLRFHYLTERQTADPARLNLKLLLVLLKYWLPAHLCTFEFSLLNSEFIMEGVLVKTPTKSLKRNLILSLMVTFWSRRIGTMFLMWSRIFSPEQDD